MLVLPAGGKQVDARSLRARSDVDHQRRRLVESLDRLHKERTSSCRKCR